MAVGEFGYLYLGIYGIVRIFLTSLTLYWSCKIFKRPVTYSQALIPGVIMGVVLLILSGINLLLMENYLLLFFKDMENPNVTSLIVFFIFAGFQLLISLVLYLFLPKHFFKLEWKQALLIALVWYGFDMAIGKILSLITFSPVVTTFTSLF